MKKFVFRPQVVLDRARDEEERLLQQMATVQHELACKDQEIAHTSEARNATLRAMSDTQQGDCDIDKLQQHRFHLDALANTLAGMREERAKIQQQLDTARHALVEAMRKRQVLEKLREKQHDAYRKEEEKQELQTMEDVKLPRLARERMEKTY